MLRHLENNRDSPRSGTVDTRRRCYNCAIGKSRPRVATSVAMSTSRRYARQRARGGVWIARQRVPSLHGSLGRWIKPNLPGWARRQRTRFYTMQMRQAAALKGWKTRKKKPRP